jgi:hypothetical protein
LPNGVPTGVPTGTAISPWLRLRAAVLEVVAPASDLLIDSRRFDVAGSAAAVGAVARRARRVTT